MSKCPTFPLALKVVNFDGVFTAGTNLIFFGPSGPANTDLAWVIFNLSFSYNAPLIAGGFFAPFYQFNRSQNERLAENRVDFGRLATDANIHYPVIGGGASLETVASGPVYAGQDRSLYLPYPDEFIIGFLGAPAGRGYQLRGLVLEVSRDTDVSTFL